MKLKEFIKKTNLTESLVRAVVRQSGGWDDFKYMARDVASHGADNGFAGWIYYGDTVSFSGKNIKPIMDHAKSVADDICKPGAYALIAGFRCLGGMNPDQVTEAIWNKKSKDRDQVMNALAWFALEEVARSYADLCDE